ncbi:MAG: polysaccharide synthesis protein GtrA [Hyphomicrobiales bacterium]|nr:polysaccharide synthesis protein GtrA [Hyphomicrobiales bacterium]
MTAYVLVGFFAAVAHFSVLIALVEYFSVPPVEAALAGYICGGVTSYLLNRRHTFQSDKSHGEAGWRFATVAGVGFMLTWGIMYVSVERAELPYLAAQVLATGIVLVWGFLANKLWTFAPVNGI